MASYASGTNTFVPTFDASGQLIVEFSRNVKKFTINEWITIIPVKKSTGYFLRITPDNAARVINSDGSEFLWADGNDAPSGEYNTNSFDFAQFATQRYNFPFRLGYKAVEQADWKIVASHAAMVGQQAMTLRSVLGVAAIETALNVGAIQTQTTHAVANSHNFGFAYASSAVAGSNPDENGSSGNAWTPLDGTSTNPLMLAALNFAAEAIVLSTLGVVQPADLVVVFSPTFARELATSPEIHDYLKQSPFALAQIRGDVPSQNGKWGLPDELYGYKIIIENCVRVTSHRDAPFASSYVLDDQKFYMLSRPGGLVGVEGSPSFSTIQQFTYEEMTVEQKDDPDNRRHLGRVVEDYQFLGVAPVSGARIATGLIQGVRNSYTAGTNGYF